MNAVFFSFFYGDALNGRSTVRPMMLVAARNEFSKCRPAPHAASNRCLVLCSFENGADITNDPPNRDLHRKIRLITGALFSLPS